MQTRLGHDLVVLGGSSLFPARHEEDKTPYSYGFGDVIRCYIRSTRDNMFGFIWDEINQLSVSSCHFFFFFFFLFALPIECTPPPTPPFVSRPPSS